MHIDTNRIKNQQRRLAIDIGAYKVPEDLVYNMDETAFLLEGTSDTSYDVQGKQNIVIRGHNARAQVSNRRH